MKTSKCIIAAIIISLSAIVGCARPMLTIYKENPLSKEVVIVARSTENMTIGRTYVIYRNEMVSTMPSSGGHAGHGGHDMGGTHHSRKMVGLVLITKILDSKTASAQVVSGDVQDGDVAEEYNYELIQKNSSYSASFCFAHSGVI